MKISNMMNLYKFISEGDGESLKEYAKMMSASETAGLRTGKWTFKVMSWIAWYYLRDKVSPKGEMIPKEHKAYYQTTDTTFNELLDLNLRIAENQKNWNTLDLLEGKPGMFCGIDKDKEGKFGNFEDLLQWNSYYATSLIRLRKYYRGAELAEINATIQGLLLGVYKCITDDAILRHPLEVIEYDLEPISQDMVSGLTQLLLSSTKEDYTTFPMLNNIKVKVVKVFTKTDYHLMYPDGFANSYDLAPNYVYNHPKAFVYAGLRMLDGKFNASDKSIVMSLLRIKPYSKDEPQHRSMYGAVVTLEALEAIALHDRDILLEAIQWAQYLVDSSYEQNAEFDSILCSLYREAGYKTRMELYAKRTLESLSSCLDIGVEKSSDTMARDLVPGTHPRPPVLRRNDDWFWQRRAYGTGAGSEVCNMIEIAGPLSRIAPVMYYPEEYSNGV
jgi:hypothetical protein